jgi:mono/diheme cytochrome c family protein
VHFNVRWRNCHFDPEAVQEVGNAETCGELRARHERGRVLLDPGSSGPGGLFTGTNPTSNGSSSTFTAQQYNQLWTVWGGYVTRPANFDQLAAERYGSAFSGDPNPYPLPGENPNQTNGGSGTLPEMFTQMRSGSGGSWTSEITVTCHACHSGQVGTRDGPGPGVLWGGGSSLADLNLLLRDMLQLGWEASAATVLNLNRTRGRNNASLVNVAFGAAGFDPSTLPGILTSGSTADMDTVAWWNMGHRPAKFVDGIFAMDTPRVDGIFYAPNLGATPQGQTWMRQNGPDLNVWVESLKSPPYPYPVDTALAEEGARLFHELDLWAPSRNNPIPQPEGNGSCAGCHGAYAERYVNDPAYLDTPALAGIAGYTVPLEVIGTDPVRVEANNEAIQEAGRSSFFAYPPTRGTPHDCGPQNHPELNDGRAPGYMAPPLNGIWATAPYFHNGSVPNVWEVLEPADRVAIWKRWSKPPITNDLPNTLGVVVMGFDTDLERAYDRDELGWRYDEIPCQVESATNPSVSPYVNCDPDPNDAIDPLSQEILDMFYSGVFLGWNLGYYPPLTPVEMEDRKIFNTEMFAQGNEGHEFTSVLSDAERRALIEYLKTL